MEEDTRGRNRSAFGSGHEYLEAFVSSLTYPTAVVVRRRRPLFGFPREGDNVDNAIYLLSADEAAPMKGRAILVGGGEHISGLLR